MRRPTPIGAGPAHWTRGVEAALAAAIVGGAAFALWFLAYRGYLPQPFYGEPSQTFMDLYNTAYWANRPGAYDIWGAVYPPLSFIFLKLTSAAHCYAGTPYEARACDAEPLAALALGYLGCWPLLAVYYARLDATTAAMRTVATGLALPLLYALERGNLIVLSFVLALAALGLPLRWKAAHHLLAALSFNLKPYAAIVLLPWLPRRRWREIAIYVTVFMSIYLGSCALLGGGWPLDLLRNVGRLISGTSAHAWNNVYYATTFNQWRAALVQPGFADQIGLRRDAVAPLRLIWAALIAVGQIGVLTCYAAAFVRPSRAVVSRLMALALLFVLTTWGASGYATVYLLPLIFRERIDGPRSALVVLFGYLLCVPADIVLRPVLHVEVESYLGGRWVAADYGLALGQLVRPTLLLAIEYLLVAQSAIDLLGRRDDKAYAKLRS